MRQTAHTSSQYKIQATVAFRPFFPPPPQVPTEAPLEDTE